MNRPTTIPMLAILGALALAGAPGCRGERSDNPPRQFFPDMDDHPKWKPQSEGPFYAAETGGGRAMRLPVAGTVAWGRVSFHPPSLESDAAVGALYEAQRRELLAEDETLARGTIPGAAVDDIAGTQFVEKIPVEVNDSLLLRGQERFNIYCSACHGYLGDGKGMVASKWSIPIPAYTDAKFFDPAQKQSRDGYLFHTARNGVVRPADGTRSMPGYAHALSIHDTWAVVAYVRVLQAARTATIDDLPADRRAVLEQAIRDETARIQAEEAATAPQPAAGGQP